MASTRVNPSRHPAAIGLIAPVKASENMRQLILRMPTPVSLTAMIPSFSSPLTETVMVLGTECELAHCRSDWRACAGALQYSPDSEVGADFDD
jgi:hypothetical protein